MIIKYSRKKSIVFLSLLILMLLNVGQVSIAATIGADSGINNPNANQSSAKKVVVKGIPGRDYAAGELVVKFKTLANISSTNKTVKAQVLRNINKNLQLVKFDNQTDILNAMEVYKNNPEVESVQLNYKAKAFLTPNDSMYSEQWALPKMQVPEAWNITQGASNVTVAIVDSGVDLDHPELAGNIVTGTDIVNPNTPPDDENGHGTHVAGIVAAIANNNRGIAGVASGVKIMPIRVLGPDGSGYSFDIYYGIKWAVDHGANIINLSLGLDSSDPIIEDGVDYAYSRGVIVVAAAGNENTAVSYPAAYPHVIAVAATDQYDRRASFSNYGPQIAVAAPGVDILSTTPNTQVDPALNLSYDYMSGTSMASPQVAGLAALILSENHNLSPDQVTKIIEDSADDLGSPGYDNYFGYGRINADKALNSVSTAASSLVPTGIIKINNGAVNTNSTAVNLSIEGLNDSSNITDMAFSNDGQNWSQWGTFSPTTTWNLVSGDGIKRVYMKLKDISGNESIATSAAIKLDTYKPVAKMIIPMYSNLISQTPTFKVSWSAEDQTTTSGIQSYDVDYRVGGTVNWISWKTDFRGLSAYFTGVAGKTYYFRVRAKDEAGNLGNWTTTNYRTIVPYDNNSLISGRMGFGYTYSSSQSQNYLGTVRYSTKANDQITYKFVGDKAALIGFKGLGQSKGKIYVDNVYRGTVDEYSSTSKYRQVVYAISWTTKGTHYIKIVNLATYGRRSFSIDGIAVEN